jgi:ATP-binding cassette subfamily B protein
MGLAATLYALLTLAILRAVQQRTVRLWVEAREGNAGLYGFIEERLAGVEDVRANGGEAYVLRRLAQLQAATYQAHNQARMFGVFTFSVTHMLFVLAGALGLGLGAYLYLQDQATIGAVYLIIYYLNILRAPLEELRDRVDELQHATASIGRVHELLQMKYMSTGRRQDTVKAEEKRRKEERMIPSTSNLQPSSSPLALRFDRVSFRYTDAQSHEHVLQEVAFELASGKVLGLLGRTGSGKTTLTRLLLRLYEPTYGAIWLNGQSLRDVSLPELRRCVGMVTQEVQLFQASLRENITLFDPGIPDEQILNVLRELGLWDWYCAQPYGLETRLSGGSSLSAGEAQLLAFVRVFLRDPRLVILDEASSRLDPATEQLLERAIDRLLYNRTAIIIAHRLETVRRADDILILEDGRVVENGRRRALANDPNSRFYGLLQTGLQEALA